MKYSDRERCAYYSGGALMAMILIGVDIGSKVYYGLHVNGLTIISFFLSSSLLWLSYFYLPNLLNKKEVKE